MEHSKLGIILLKIPHDYLEIQDADSHNMKFHDTRMAKNIGMELNFGSFRQILFCQHFILIL